MTEPVDETDQLLSVACDVVGTFDENAFGVEYTQQDPGPRVVDEKYEAEQFDNGHYLG